MSTLGSSVRGAVDPGPLPKAARGVLGSHRRTAVRPLRARTLCLVRLSRVSLSSVGYVVVRSCDECAVLRTSVYVGQWVDERQ